ncbi:MAG: hypothetical protein NTV57_08090 [Cyanobacteria bacterium]|nr:hypothetical protein [Cyanobacteriota bacterium]
MVFLSGFDPRGASFYYRLFAEQLRRYQQRGDRIFELERRRLADRLLSRWQVLEAGQPQLDVCFLRWDDIAREHWPRQPLVLVRDGLIFYAWYLLGGGIARIGRLSWRVALCGFYPGLFALLALGGGVVLASALVHGVALAGFGLGTGGWAWAGLVLAVWLGAAWRLADRIGVVWLFRSIWFTHGLARARETTLRQRVEELAERLLELEEQDHAEEVWLVGHSSGSFVMAMLAAELRRRGAWPALGGRLRLLSLGQNLANLAVHHQATGFHADLALLAEEPRVPWLDITSHDDYLCFAGVDPYASCGVACPGSAFPKLRLIPLAQRQHLTTWWALASHQFDLHFEYLRTAKPGQSGGFDLYEHLLDRDRGEAQT